MAESLTELENCLLDLTQPLAKRTHAAFHLRTNGSRDAAAIIAKEIKLVALRIREDGVLMRHELAYILGQMQHPEFCEVLSDILTDESDDTIVRHESAEALGAIGNISSLEVLKQFSTHSQVEISETCKIAVDLICWKQQGENIQRCNYLSVDPAPPFTTKLSISELRGTLVDPSKSLFERYRAMFSLRNIDSDASALAIAAGFSDESALFRHEVAYVLGQMSRTVTVPSLSAVLCDAAEHRMVRHEAAEALGAIGGSDVCELLAQFGNEREEAIVKDSCIVALDTMDYWNSFNTSNVNNYESTIVA